MRFRLAAASVAVVFLITGGAIYGTAQQRGAQEPLPPITPSAAAEEKVVLPAMAERATAASPVTRVSLTFDDGWESQLLAIDSMSEHGMPGTFYIASGLIGHEGYLTRAELDAVAEVGHEIGGHSVSHADLTTMTPDEVEVELCASRDTLTRWGYDITSFAYPFASVNPEVEEEVEHCGYNSGRGLGNLASRDGCQECLRAETLPPPDPFNLRAPAQVTDDWTLADLQSVVTSAEQSGGGWVPITFHEVCEDQGCSSIGISQALFDEFLAWLHPRAASHGTVVQTVHEVIGGEVQPLVDEREYAQKPAPRGENGVRNAGFEQRAENGATICWMEGVYGDNDGVVEFTDGRRGTGVAITIEDYSYGDAKVVPSQDAGICAPAVEDGRKYSLRAWYKSNAESQFAVYLRDRDGKWSMWRYSPYFPVSGEWTQAVWTTPEIPRGTTAISFGLSLSRAGQVVVDDYAIYDSEGAPSE